VDDLLRLLELVRRELDAEDAHVRLGGRRDDDPRTVEHELRAGCCVVVRLREPPAQPREAAERLAELARAFAGTVEHAIETIDAAWSRPSSAHALVQTLADLRDATGAAVALVVDRQSPVIWGCSDPGLGLRDRPAARVLAIALASLRAQGLDWASAALTAPKAPDAAGELPGSASLELARRALQSAERSQPGGAARLVAATRALLALDTAPDAPAYLPEGEEPGLASKGFGGLYCVALVFTRPFSPLRVEGVLRRARPIIERLVLELPPLDPEPMGGRVVPLRRD
jgi:hypothetical protein